MQTSNVLTPTEPARPFVPSIVALPKKGEPAQAKGPAPKAPIAPKPLPDFRVPRLGLFHGAAQGRAVHRWETVVFVVMAVSGLVAVVLAFL